MPYISKLLAFILVAIGVAIMLIWFASGIVAGVEKLLVMAAIIAVGFIAVRRFVLPARHSAGNAADHHTDVE